MNKTQFIEATKGMMNSVREFNGHKIQNIAYMNDPWILLQGDEIHTRDEYYDTTFPKFHTREDLWKYIKTI